METERADKKTWEDIQTHLRRKVRKHKDLMKGRTGGLSEEQIANLPLDVDSALRARVSDSDDDSSSEVRSRLTGNRLFNLAIGRWW